MSTRIAKPITTHATPAAAKAPAAAPVVDRAALMPPRRPPISFLPSTEQITTLVERALKALSHGIIWDRGSILNTIV